MTRLPGVTRAEVQRWIGRAEAFASRAQAVATRDEALRLLTSAIAEARSLGLAVRLARAATWWSAGAPSRPVDGSLWSLRR